MPDEKLVQIVTRERERLAVRTIEPSDKLPLAHRIVTTKSTSALPLSFTRDLPLTQAAVEFASERHSGQVRAADGAPFVAHPIETASLLERSHYPDHVIAAAVLHDVLEDTWTTREELQERFGTEVAELVATLSDDPSIADERERRADLRERVRQAGGYAAAVYAADKVSKVRELRAMLARGIDAAETPGKREHYERSLAMLERVIPGSRVVEVLRFELEELAALPPGPPRRT